MKFLLVCLQAAAVLVFLKGFLLTRVELPDIAAAAPAFDSISISSGSGQPTAGAPPAAYSKAVVLIVDAVRYDFLCGKGDGGSASANGQQHQFAGSLMPKTLQWVRAGAAGGAAVASRFIADTPTITMSRLKALLTGGLPTFLDVGQSFSASAITEDNLLGQLLAVNKTLVMMGDDTWMQLAEAAFTEAYPYPSFNVHDLHTVDDGVWEHLIPLLARPHSWDVLIAHYLGVDHAGHTHGVASRQMEAKLAQMDDQVSTVMESLVSQAGPGGPYEHTLLVVLSDHGQTQGGDHGGGTPDETDSILVAMGLRHMHAATQQQQQQQQEQEQDTEADAGSSQGGGSTKREQDSELLLRLMLSAGYAAAADGVEQHLQQLSAAPAAASPSAAALSSLLVCHNTVPQIDLTPLLAYLLGVSIPFGNLGKLPPHLFATLTGAAAVAGRPAAPAAAAAGGAAAADAAGVAAAGGGGGAWLPQYSAALAGNADQVHTYLNRYAAVGGLPAAQLAAVNALYAQLQLHQQQHLEDAAAAGSPAAATESSGSGSSGGRQQQQQQRVALEQLEQLVEAQLQYLAAAADLARRRFTLFQQGPMWAGCVMAVVVLLGQLWYLRRVLARLAPSPSRQQQQQTQQPKQQQQQQPRWDSVSTLGFAALAVFHALGLFSVGLLMGEGRLTCVLLAAVTLLLLRAALVAVLQARRVAAQAASVSKGPLLQQHQQPASDATSTSAQAHSGVNGSCGPAAVEDLASGSTPAQQHQHQVQLVLPGVIESWASWQPCSQAVRAAVSMLVCNVSLQLLGLIDRSGQDPHDKTQPTSELLVGPDAAWQRAALVAFTVGPLVVLCVIFRAAGRMLGGSRKGNNAGNSCSDRSGSCRSGVVAVAEGFLKAVCASQYVCLALFWIAQLYGHSNATVCGVLHAAWAVVQQSPVGGSTADVVASLTQAATAVLGQDVLQGGCSSTWVCDALCLLPVRLVLPRVIYMSALLVLVGTVLVALWPQRLLPSGAQQHGANAADGVVGECVMSPAVAGVGGVLGSSDLVLARLLLWVCAVLAAPVMTVLGFKGPATMLLALLQAVGLCRLLRLQRAASAFVAAACQDPLPPHQQQESATASATASPLAATAVCEDGCCSVVGAGAWGLMALQLFFCSGHFCEFSGLQYASAFLGFDDMVWYSSGSLLLINTCGFLFLGPLSLPVLLACCCCCPAAPNIKDSQVSQSTQSTVRGSSSSKRGLSQWRQQVEAGMWVGNCMRFAALTASLVSAAVQQQHILLWAIFAPKLVFELCFMAVTAGGQLLATGLLPPCDAEAV